jgi:hypothetical protein
MSSYKVEQRRLTHRGREFHFVSYEGQPGNVARQVAATVPTWFLMNGGKRWPVVPHMLGQAPGDLDRLFADWLESHVFA